jgi:hypothetical protein
MDWSISIATGLEPSGDDKLKTRAERLPFQDIPIGDSANASASASISNRRLSASSD